jgi:hypothetical protein
MLRELVCEIYVMVWGKGHTCELRAQDSFDDSWFNSVDSGLSKELLFKGRRMSLDDVDEESQDSAFTTALKCLDKEIKCKWPFVLESG